MHPKMPTCHVVSIVMMEVYTTQTAMVDGVGISDTLERYTVHPYNQVRLQLPCILKWNFKSETDKEVRFLFFRKRFKLSYFFFFFFSFGLLI